MSRAALAFGLRQQALGIDLALKAGIPGGSSGSCAGYRVGVGGVAGVRRLAGSQHALGWCEGRGAH
jgi:hypothetical protein